MTTVQTTITTAKESKQPMITSLDVAEMVGKQHSNVMRDIRNIKEDLDNLKIESISYFVESTYKDKLNRNKPMFLLTKKGCELYGNRMTGIDGTAFSVQYIDRFNDMEEAEQQRALPSYQIENPIERAKVWIGEEEKRQQLQLEVKEKEELLIEQAPKVEALDAITGNTDKLYTITQIATNYGMTAVKMNNLLHKMGVQYKQSGIWKLYAKYEGNGYTVTPTGQTDDGYTFKNMKWTNKGEYFLYQLLKEEGHTSTTYDLMFKEQDNL